MSFITEIKTFAALGSGVIGSGWVSRALAHGLDVVAWDPAPGAEAALRKRVANAWGALEQQGLVPGASQNRLRFVATIEECVKDADFIQESAPERLELKLDLHSRISAAARPNVLIGSSTSGLLPSDFYESSAHPERCVVGHPFNPVYLLPLVEVVGGKILLRRPFRRRSRSMNPSVCARCMCARKSPALSLTACSKRYGARRCIWSMTAWRPPAKSMMRFASAPGCAGRSWAHFSPTLAGGDAGMRHFMTQFGPALQLPWTYLPAPELTGKLIDDVVDGTTDQLGKHSISALERYRDDCLLAVMEAVKTTKARHGMSFAE